MGLAPVSMSDIGNFVNSCLSGFSNVILYSLCLMFAFSIAFFIKRLFVGSVNL